MSWKSKAAALVGMAASAAVAYLAIAGATVGSVAFAQVAEKFRAARTLTFDWVEKRVADGTTLGQGRGLYMVPGKVRIEIDGEGGGRSYFVADSSKSKVIFVDTKPKTAQLIPLDSFRKRDMAAAAIDELQSLNVRATRSLGRKSIAGVAATGFVVDGEDKTTTVWADVASGDPIRVEVRGTAAAENPTELVWTHIKLDQPLDPRLFSVVPPEGFRSVPLKPVDTKATRAFHVAEFLKLYAKCFEGQLPANLKDAPQSLSEAFRSSPERRPSMGELMPLPMYIASMHAMMRKGEQGKDWQYFPGHKVGEVDQLIFWARERASGDYFGVYGDLRIEQVDESGLSAAPAD